MDEQEIPRPVSNYVPAWPPVTTETFTSLSADSPILIVHFWAVWNGYDRIMESRLNETKHRLPEPAQILSCNIDDADCFEFAKNSGVVNIPWLSVFVNGRIHGHICGLRAPDTLANELIAFIANEPIAPPRKWWRFW